MKFTKNRTWGSNSRLRESENLRVTFLITFFVVFVDFVLKALYGNTISSVKNPGSVRVPTSKSFAQ
jgi:hypothetical protein